MTNGLRFSANEKKKEKYYRLIQNGLCGRCGKKREQKDKSYCNNCLKMAKKSIQKNRKNNSLI
jgi:hypothetical protein